MRISTSVMNKTITGAMSNAYNDYAKIIQQISSKKNFTKMSQNPVDASKVLKLKDQLSQVENYQSNIKAATNEMNLAYDTLGDLSDEISSIKDKIIEASNGSTTAESAKAIAAEIKEKVSIVQDKMNTKYMDNYIFSGTYTNKAPYALNTIEKEVVETLEDGTETITTEQVKKITYQGSSKKAGDRNITVAEDKVISYNFTGEEILNTKDGGDFFSQMEEINTLLNAEPLDHDAIRSKLDVLDGYLKNITSTQGMVSSKVTALDKAYDNNADTILKLTEDCSDLEDIDILKAASDLTSAQQALQASYAIGSQVLGSVSLLDYL